MPTKETALRPVPSATTDATWQQVTDAFLRRDLATNSVRVYRLTLDRLGREVGADARLADLTPQALATAVHAAYPHAAPASWNRHVATLRSFIAFANRHGWLDHDPASALERRRVAESPGVV